MAINRIKYVNIGSKMEESDFVKHSSGGCVLQSLTATENGTYLPPEGVDGFDRVDVNVIDPLSIKYEIDNEGTLQKKPVVMDFAGIEDVGDFALMYAYSNMGEEISGVISFPDLIKVTGYEACEGAFWGDYIVNVSMPKLEKIEGTFSCYGMFEVSKVRGVNLKSLKTVSGESAASNMFYSCPIVNIELPKLETIQGPSAADSMFRDTNITWPVISRLKTIYGNSACANMFRGCKNLNGTIFESLTTITGSGACSYMFADSNSEQFKIFSFPALRTVSSSDAFNNMFSNSVNVTVAFPKNMQTKIESQTGYSSTNPFGATSGTVGFYLPSTYLLRGNGGTYERNPIADYNGENSAWRVLGTSPDSTSFWISGGVHNDPIVGTPIYSDKECTIQVDTVTSIEQEE